MTDQKLLQKLQSEYDLKMEKLDKLWIKIYDLRLKIEKENN